MNSTRDDLTSPSCGAPQYTPAEQHHRAAQLRALLFEAVGATSAYGILLSGGLDTSILATIAAAQGHRLCAVLVSVADAPGPDEAFARLMAERLGLELRVLRPRLRGLVKRMPEVIPILRTFDPMELRNSVSPILLWRPHRSGTCERC